MSPTDPYERATQADQFFDYCMYRYTPTVAFAGKLRSAALLRHSFEAAQVGGRAWELVEAIREAVGVSRTVWGLKRLGDKIAWEFYFYDYKRRERAVSLSTVLRAVEPFAACSVTPNENLHYFMFSIDVDERLVRGSRGIDEIHMYLGNVGSTVSSGIAYSLTAQRTALENFYFFFDAKTQLEDVAAKICCSAYLDTTQVSLDAVLWPELRACKTICVANKQGNDCVYFSGVDVEQFLVFLRRMRYPGGLVSFVEANKQGLDHLQFDVGFDYRMQEGRLVVVKSGYYGTF